MRIKKPFSSSQLGPTHKVKFLAPAYSTSGGAGHAPVKAVDVLDNALIEKLDHPEKRHGKRI